MVYTESIRNILERIHKFMFGAHNKGCRGGYIRWLIALRTAAGWPKSSPAIFWGAQAVVRGTNCGCLWHRRPELLGKLQRPDALPVPALMVRAALFALRSPICSQLLKSAGRCCGGPCCV